MAQTFNNTLLPDYNNTVKAAKKGGYSSLFLGKTKNLAGRLYDRQVDFLKNTPAAQEKYKAENPRPPEGYPWEESFPGTSAVDTANNYLYRDTPGTTPLTVEQQNQIALDRNQQIVDDYTNPNSLVGEIAKNINTNYIPAPTVTPDARPKGNVMSFDLSGNEVSLENKPGTDIKTTNTPIIPDYKKPGSETNTPPPGQEVNPLKDKIQSDLLAVLNGGAFPGTENAVSAQREALATYAKDLQGKAGLNASKRGGIGQGTQSGAQNMVAKNIMQELGNTERDIAGLRAADYKEALTQGINTSQFGEKIAMQEKELAQSGRISDESLAIQRDQLKQTGRIADTNVLLDMSADNPILQSKLINSVMGTQGIEFTPAEQEKLEDYYEKAASRDEKLSAAETQVLEALPEVFKKSIQSQLAATKSEKLENTVKLEVLGIDAEGNAIEDFEFNPEIVSTWDNQKWTEAKSDPDVWDKLTSELPNKGLDAYKLYRDLTSQGLEADSYEKVLRTGFKADKITDTDGAGGGKGSVIIANGVPYRIVKVRRMNNKRTTPNQHYTTVTYLDLTKDPTSPDATVDKKYNE